MPKGRVADSPLYGSYDNRMCEVAVVGAVKGKGFHRYTRASGSVQRGLDQPKMGY